MSLPLTLTETSMLITVPIVLPAVHLKANTPPVVIGLFQTPPLWLVSFTGASFTYNWYVWTAGLLLAEQLKVMLSPWQTVVSLATNWTISGLTTIKSKWVLFSGCYWLKNRCFSFEDLISYSYTCYSFYGVRKDGKLDELNVPVSALVVNCTVVSCKAGNHYNH